MGLFDNAKTVMIGNKEVQSIKITSNNAVLYEKPSAGLVPDSLSLTATKSVLSCYHNESSVLTATVLDSNNQPCSGETVVFKNGNVTLASRTTDSNGQCTYTYVGGGVGDVTLSAECRLLIQTYAIEDLEYNNPLLQDTTGWSLSNTNATLTTESNGMKFFQKANTGNYNTFAGLNVPLDLANHNYEVEFDLIDYNTSDNTPIRHSIAQDLQGNNSVRSVMINTTAFTVVMDGSRQAKTSLSKPSHFKIHMENGNHILWVNNSQRATSNKTFGTVYYGIHTWQNQYNVIANFRIKRL